MDDEYFVNRSFCAIYNENEESIPIKNKLNRSDLNLTENSNIYEATLSNKNINNSKLTIDENSDIDAPDLRIFNDKILNLETEVEMGNKQTFAKESLVKESPKFNFKIYKSNNGAVKIKSIFNSNQASVKKKASKLNNKNSVKVLEKRNSPVKDLNLINNKILNKANYMVNLSPLKGNSKKSFLELSRNFLEKKNSLKTSRNYSTNKSLNFNGLNISKEFDIKSKMKIQSKIKLFEPLKSPKKKERVVPKVNTKLIDIAEIKPDLPKKRNVRNSVDFGVLNKGSFIMDRKEEADGKDYKHNSQKNFSAIKNNNFAKIGSKNMFANVPSKINIPKFSKIKTGEDKKIIKDVEFKLICKSPIKPLNKFQVQMNSSKKSMPPYKSPINLQNKNFKNEKSNNNLIKVNHSLNKEMNYPTLTFKKVDNKENLLIKGSKTSFKTNKNNINSPEIKKVKKKIIFDDEKPHNKSKKTAYNLKSTSPEIKIYKENEDDKNKDLMNSTGFFQELKNSFNQFENRFNEEINLKFNNDKDNKIDNLKDLFSSFDKQNRFYKEFFSLITVYYNILIEKNKNLNGKNNREHKKFSLNKSNNCMDSSELFKIKESEKDQHEKELEMLEKEYLKLKNKYDKIIQESELSYEEKDEAIDENIYDQSDIDVLKQEIEKLIIDKNQNINLAKRNLKILRENEKKIYDLNECLIKLNEKELENLNKDIENTKLKQHSQNKTSIRLFHSKNLNLSLSLRNAFSDSNFNNKCSSLLVDEIIDTSQLKKTKSLNTFNPKDKLSYNDSNDKSFSFRTGNISDISFENNHKNNKENFNDADFNFSFYKNKTLIDNNFETSFYIKNKQVGSTISKSLDKLPECNKKNILMKGFINFFKEEEKQERLYNSCDQNFLNEKSNRNFIFRGNKKKSDSIKLDEGNKTLIFNFHLNINNMNNNYFTSLDKPESNNMEFKRLLCSYKSYGDNEMIEKPEENIKSDNTVAENNNKISNADSTELIKTGKDDKDEIMEFYKMLTKNISTGNLKSILKEKLFNELSKKNLLKNSNKNNLNVKSYYNIGIKDRIKDNIMKMHAVDSIKNFLNNRSLEQSFNDCVLDYFDGINNIELND